MKFHNAAVTLNAIIENMDGDINTRLASRDGDSVGIFNCIFGITAQRDSQCAVIAVVASHGDNSGIVFKHR